MRYAGKMTVVVVVLGLLVFLMMRYGTFENPLKGSFSRAQDYVEEQKEWLANAKANAPRLVGTWDVPEDGIEWTWDRGLLVHLKRDGLRAYLVVRGTHRFYRCFANMVETSREHYGPVSNLRQVTLVLADKPQDVQSDLPVDVHEKDAVSAAFLMPTRMVLVSGATYLIDPRDYLPVDYDEYWREYLREMYAVTKVGKQPEG